MDPLSVTAVELSRQHKSINRYSRYLSSRVSSGPSLDSLMNGVIKEKIKIIPKDVRWGGQSNQVFSVLSGDFMKPRIIEVDELLSLGVNVTVYNGQLDLICATKGTEAWVQKLKWEGLQTFTNTGRTPLFCGNEDGTKGFTKSYRNFHFYWILKAWHFVKCAEVVKSLPSTGMAAHAVDGLIEAIEIDEKSEAVGATTVDEIEAADNKATFSYMPPPPPPVSQNAYKQFEADDEDVDVDVEKIDSEMVDIDLNCEVDIDQV